MTPDPIPIVKASYARCLDSPEFLQAFYRHFFANCPGAEPLFAGTDLDRQTRLLQHAIGLLLIFPTEPKKEPTVLSRLAAKHGPTELKINPSWFPIFLESLVQTAGRHDPEFTPAIATAWRQALEPGVAYMQRHAKVGTSPTHR